MELYRGWSLETTNLDGASLAEKVSVGLSLNLGLFFGQVSQFERNFSINSEFVLFIFIVSTILGLDCSTIIKILGTFI